MHFSSIIITNTGWLLDKPRERARAKKRIRDRRDRLHLSISSRRKLSRFITFRRASREDDVKSRSHRRTHIDARVHTTRWRENTNERNSDRLELDPRVWCCARTIAEDARRADSFCISTYPRSCVMYSRHIRYYICVGSAYVCVCVLYICFTYVYV